MVKRYVPSKRVALLFCLLQAQSSGASTFDRRVLEPQDEARSEQLTFIWKNSFIEFSRREKWENNSWLAPHEGDQYSRACAARLRYLGGDQRAEVFRAKGEEPDRKRTLADCVKLHANINLPVEGGWRVRSVNWWGDFKSITKTNEFGSSLVTQAYEQAGAFPGEYARGWFYSPDTKATGCVVHLEYTTPGGEKKQTSIDLRGEMHAFGGSVQIVPYSTEVITVDAQGKQQRAFLPERLNGKSFLEVDSTLTREQLEEQKKTPLHLFDFGFDESFYLYDQTTGLPTDVKHAAYHGFPAMRRQFLFKVPDYAGTFEPSFKVIEGPNNNSNPKHNCLPIFDRTEVFNYKMYRAGSVRVAYSFGGTHALRATDDYRLLAIDYNSGPDAMRDFFAEHDDYYTIQLISQRIPIN
jgi:hypothetical protein